MTPPLCTLEKNTSRSSERNQSAWSSSSPLDNSGKNQSGEELLGEEIAADADCSNDGVELDTPWELCQAAQPPIKLETTGVTPQPTKSLQTEFWQKQRVFTDSIAAKLREAGLYDQAHTLDYCHTEHTYQRCTGCNKSVSFLNHCDSQWCPMCQPALAHARKKQVEWWAANVLQPKHVVLTLKNVTDLTPERIAEAKQYLARLRRRKFCKNWLGGLWSLEITNEGRGWHIHFHVLVDAKWVDAGKLARVWADVTNGGSYIVKVKDCRNKSYLAEVTKYAVKGSQLAGWAPADIATFVTCIHRCRTFGVFGTLYKLRPLWRAHLDNVSVRKCECGCQSFQYFDQNEWDALWCRPTIARPPPSPQLMFL